ncbi:hypothetical protein Tco_0506087, partial [Tanacetum coccineum]
YDPLALVDSFTLVEDNIGLLETRFDVEAVFVIMFPEDVTGSVNLTLLSLFFGVTATNFPSVLLILGQIRNVEGIVDITELFRKLKFICYWTNPFKDFEWSNVPGIKLSSFSKSDDSFTSLQALSNLHYFLGGFLDYFWPFIQNEQVLWPKRIPNLYYVGCNMDKKSTSAEAEDVATVGCCANILWIKSQLTDYDIIYEKIKNHTLKRDIEIHFIPTQYQLTDIFIKLLDKPSLKR